MSTSKPTEEQEFLRLSDLAALCLARWHWFVLSLVLCLGAATCYLLTTPPVYTRDAALRIKNDSKGKSATTDMESFADFGMFTSNTSVNDEMATLRSPDIVREVVTRLRLNVTYRVDGSFHKNVIYGPQLPVSVRFGGLPDTSSSTLRLTLKADGTVAIDRLTRDGEDCPSDYSLRLGQTVSTPAGRLTVSATKAYQKGEEREIYVTRIPVSTALSAVSSALTVAQADEKSNIITLSYRDVSPKRAEDVLGTLIAVYNETWVKDKNQIAVSTSQFIKERLGVIESELGSVDNSISSYKSQHLVPDVQAAANMYMNQATQAGEAVKALENQAYMARYIRNYLTNETSRFQLLPTNSGIDNPNISAQINEYNQQMLERNSLVSHSSTKSPLVVEMDASLAQLRKALLTSIDNQQVAIGAQIRSQQSTSGQATSQIASNPKQARYLLSVERQQKVKESLYLYLLQKREENELSQAFTAYNTRVIAMPSGSAAPTSPVSRNILLAAFLIGLLAPVAIILVRENMNTVVRGRKDLDSLSAPIAGEIPQAVRMTRRYGIFPRKVFPDETKILVRQGSRNVVNEAFRVLRSNIDFMMAADRAANVFCLTSFNPGSGKSFLAINLATAFAIKGKRVIVVDGDFRRGSTSRFVGSPETGLSDYLGAQVSDWRRLAIPVEGHETLCVLPVGTTPPNPTDLLENGRLATLVAELRKEYDYVFLDCPPIDIVADAQVLEREADRTLFVVRAGLLDRSMLPELETIYTTKRFKNLSVVLNATETAASRYGSRYASRYGYHYGYGSYGSYGSKGDKE